MRPNLKAIETRVAQLAGLDSYDREFIFDLLLAYGKPQGNVTRLRNGSLNVADDRETEVAQKNIVYFKASGSDPLDLIDELKTSPAVVRYNTRFVIVTDFNELAAVDTKTGENLIIKIGDIDRHFTFFLPWAGIEKTQYVSEAHADIKAAERMGKLFDELVATNLGLLDLPEGRHALNVFFTRLLFCFFAEDTGIFAESQFTNAVGSHTQANGYDVNEFLQDLFVALDTANPTAKPTYLAEFPYVNGRLFSVETSQFVPKFTKKARDLLIELGTLVWREINPDIFGSMFQAIVTAVRRSDLGQHYTSVPNILRSIEPLFLDGLKEQFDVGYDQVKKLEALLKRIGTIKVFDPACGSGNFLVIAYKELRKLEHAVLERLAELDPKHQVLFAESVINIENFYGIELDDFAVEVAILSLWIAKHQMNAEFKEKFSVSIPLIPLKETGKIHGGNAARIDWNTICPNAGGEIYLIGNPPYSGFSKQTPEQKADYPLALGNRKYSKKLNYIALWFIKGADYIEGTRAQLAFVTTKTVTQGEHVGLMFPLIFSRGVEIGFANTGFQWENNARGNADVTVAVIGLRQESSAPKYLYTGDRRLTAANINGYLAAGDNVFVDARAKPLSLLPTMLLGSTATDGGNLMLSQSERDRILADSPGALPFIKTALGADEFINGEDRYCVWVEPSDAQRAAEIPELARRFERTKAMRLASPKMATKRLADVPYRFGEVRYKPTEAILVPGRSSGLREYIPMGYVGPDTVVTNLASAIYEPEPWVFTLLMSKLHMVWVSAVVGRMRINYRYSTRLAYNNFPVPTLSGELKELLTDAALRILDVREYHCEKTLAELYAPDKMPVDLLAAHAEANALVDSIYSKRGYDTDEERLSDLFAMYEALNNAEKAGAAKGGKP